MRGGHEKHHEKVGKIRKALAMIETYGTIDGAHHKQWVLDQVARALTGEGYDKWLKEWRGEWDQGTPP